MNKKYFIITYGCQMNESDSEQIAASLRLQGYKPAENAEQADLVVINACSVRQSAMHRVYDRINKYHKDKKIILAGCVLESDKKKFKDKVYQIWHPDEYFEYGKQKIDPHRSAIGLPKANRKDRRKSAYIPIMTGCNNFCSYCVVPYTRGGEKSRPADEIIKEVKDLIKNGCGEILLLGQNVNSYKSYIDKKIYSSSERSESRSYMAKSSRQARTINNINFAKLLCLINAIPGKFTIKFLSSHPKDMSDELINAIARCKKVTKEIHLPIQSGDNTILKKMNRKYTVTHYKKLIKKIRQKMPDAIISTDVIVGFPGETKKQFDNTVKLFKEIKFAKAYVAMYSPRPGTTAHKLKDDVPIQEKKRRWKILDGIVNKKRVDR